MYQALYRKYRPRRFSDVAGQDHITGTLRRQITLDKLSHAYLFVGTRGTGKTSCAKILARAVNCEAPDGGEPCNKCPSCIGIENGSILDVLELDAASNNGVDNVRALREEAIYTPASVKKRVYIIDEVHMLSTAAFNALLKILEEPPEHLLFILATTELHKVPATILSRCQRFSFKRLSPAAIAARLRYISENEKLTLTPDAAEKLASLADGSMRDAVSLLDQCASDTMIDLPRVLDTIGLAGQQELIDLANAAAGRDTAAALGVFDRLYNDGRDMASLLSEFAALARDILVFKLSKDSPLLSGSFSAAELSGLSAKLDQTRLFSFLEVIRETAYSVSRGTSVKLSVEMCLIRMCDERLSDDFPALLSRIKRLEELTAEQKSANGELRVESGELRVESREPRAESGELRVESGEGEVTVNNSNSQAIQSDTNEDLANSQFSMRSALFSNSQSDTTPLSTLNPPDPPVGAGDFWSDILEILKSDIAVYAVLSNSSRVQAELRDNILILRTGEPSIASQIESKMFAEPLKKAASDVLGREVVIRAETDGKSNNISENKLDKLDQLSMFGIVKYE